MNALSTFETLLFSAGYHLKEDKYTRHCSHGSVVIKCKLLGGGLTVKAKTKPLERPVRETVFHHIISDVELSHILDSIHI